MTDELSDAIEENAQKPRRASEDGIEVEQHPLPDQIEADRYLRAKEAMSTPAKGLRFTKLLHPGAA